MYIVSTNANDTAAGTGIRSVLITYFTSDLLSSQTSNTIVLNGTTPVLIGNIYRIYEVIGVTWGSSGSNQGDLVIQNAGATQRYPGVFAFFRNIWYTSHIFIPNTIGFTQNPKFNFNAIIDYVYYHIEEDGVNTPFKIRAFSKRNGSSIWVNIFSLTLLLGGELHPDLKNIVLPTLGNSYDLVWTIQKTSGVGEAYISGTIGWHLE
jgi:hypothetical protein